MNEKKGASRREFLTGNLGSTSNSPDNVADGDDSETPGPGRFVDTDQHRQLYFEKYSKNAMACQFELMFNMHQYQNAAASAFKVFELIDAYEEQLSIYRPSSELSQINGNAFDAPFHVERKLYHLLELSKTIFQQTDGAFDITSSPLSDVWGFSRREGKIPDQSQIENALSNVSSEHFDLIDDSIKFCRPIRLNLGGIGKGYTLDNATQLLESEDLCDFVIHGGQSSVVARGNLIEQNGSVGRGWKIGLTDPVIPNRRLAEISLVNEALGTSGTGRQGFFFNGKRYGHIIDPRNGYPTDHFLSSTVICGSAARADALATAFFVMSIDEIQRFCDEHSDVKSIIVMTSPNSAKLIIESFNLSSDDWLLIR